MGNDVSIFGGKPLSINTEDMGALAEKAQTSAQSGARQGAPDGSQYLNFSGKRGIATLGSGNDAETITDDERWLVNVHSFEDGFVCWKSQKPHSVRMANIYTGTPVAAPAADEGGPFDPAKGEGWFQAKAMVLRSVDEDGRQGYFRINSVSGVGSFSELQDAFAARASQGLAAWPIVRITIEKFESQGFTNYKPVFAIDGWLDNEQVQRLAEGEDIDDLLAEGEEEAAPETKKVTAKPGSAGRRRVTKK